MMHYIFGSISKIFCWFPRKYHLILAQMMGILWFDILRFRRKLVLENLKLAYPNETQKWRNNIGRKSIQNLCLSFLDYFVLYQLNKKNLSKYFVLEDVKSLDDQLAKKEGVLVLSLHLGTIDLAPASLALLGYPLSITLKEIKNETINTFIDQVRRSKGVRPLADRRNPFEIFRAIKRGDLTVFVMDQYMGNPHGIEITFFGLPAGTASGLAGFSMKTQLPVIPMYNFRREDGKVYVCSLPPIYPETISDNFDENIRYNTQKYNDIIEKIVKKHPDQWMWVHRRWKKFS